MGKGEGWCFCNVWKYAAEQFFALTCLILIAGPVLFGVGISFLVSIRYTQELKHNAVKSAINTWEHDATNGYTRFSQQQLSAHVHFSCGSTYNVVMQAVSSPADIFPSDLASLATYPQTRFTANITPVVPSFYSQCTVEFTLLDAATEKIIVNRTYSYRQSVNFPSQLGRYFCPAVLEQCNSEFDNNHVNCQANCQAAGGTFSCNPYNFSHTCSVPMHLSSICIKTSFPKPPPNATSTPIPPQTDISPSLQADPIYPYIGAGCAEQPLGIPGLPREEGLVLGDGSSGVEVGEKFTVTVRSSYDPYLKQLALQNELGVLHLKKGQSMALGICFTEVGGLMCLCYFAVCFWSWKYLIPANRPTERPTDFLGRTLFDITENLHKRQAWNTYKRRQNRYGALPDADSELASVPTAEPIPLTNNI